jgi:hypothetical protein
MVTGNGETLVGFDAVVVRVTTGVLLHEVGNMKKPMEYSRKKKLFPSRQPPALPHNLYVSCALLCVNKINFREKGTMIKRFRRPPE